MLTITTPCFSQEGENRSEKFNSHHSISALLSHTMIKDGIRDGKNEWIAFPSFAFDYNFVFSHKWKIGLHNDLIFEDFIVKTDNKELERSEPISSVVVGGFKPGKQFTFESGLGYEFSKEDNLFLTRIGTEYSIELPKEWELIVNLVYDVKWDAYDSFSFGVGVSKSFGQ